MKGGEGAVACKHAGREGGKSRIRNYCYSILKEEEFEWEAAMMRLLAVDSSSAGRKKNNRGQKEKDNLAS